MRSDNDHYKGKWLIIVKMHYAVLYNIQNIYMLDMLTGHATYTHMIYFFLLWDPNSFGFVLVVPVSQFSRNSYFIQQHFLYIYVAWTGLHFCANILFFENTTIHEEIILTLQSIFFLSNNQGENVDHDIICKHRRNEITDSLQNSSWQ